ncbi:hypothetical protein E2C01_082015 [Portunus trituberculatus]|uniref:Uncharacterized protein n=1 Tax=Portunus trituberculatus TaxID=210409 RepID=A0A5B7IY48_PORTR|nr:hypothetical protein [Portunus trituberculatus]
MSLGGVTESCLSEEVTTATWCSLTPCGASGLAGEYREGRKEEKEGDYWPEERGKRQGKKGRGGGRCYTIPVRPTHTYEFSTLVLDFPNTGHIPATRGKSCSIARPHYNNR